MPTTKKNIEHRFQFSAINPYEIESIPNNNQDNYNNTSYVRYGNNNRFPNWLYDCYNQCPTLASVINGTADFVLGNGVSFSDGSIMANNSSSLEEVLKPFVVDYLIFGYSCLEVIENNIGEISSINYIDARYIRSDEDNNSFYYNESFAKEYQKSNKTIVLPKYIKGCGRGIIMMKNPQGRNTYSSPIWASAYESIQTEIEIIHFHYHSILNGFTPSAIINFNNGEPTDEQKDMIEKNVIEKFSGSKNTGRILISFNEGTDNQATIQPLTSEDYGEKYQALASHTQRQIFAVFGANANLFGIPTENNGFNSEEYDSTFKLYNRTRVKPIQKMLLNLFNKLNKSIEILPFNLDLE